MSDTSHALLLLPRHTYYVTIYVIQYAIFCVASLVHTVNDYPFVVKLSYIPFYDGTSNAEHIQNHIRATHFDDISLSVHILSAASNDKT